MSKANKIAAGVIVLLIVAGAVYGLVKYWQKNTTYPTGTAENQSATQTSNSAMQQPLSGHNHVNAPSGQLVSGFPRDLILEKNAAITQSYSEDVQSDTKQFVAEYSSKLALKDLYNLYLDYFQKNGYTIVNKTLNNTAVLYAQKGNAIVNLLDYKKGNGYSVLITYVITTK